MWIFVKILGKSQFWSNFMKISISVKFLGIHDLFNPSWFWPKMSNFVKNCRKLSQFLSKFSKILILVKIYKILAFRQNFRKSWFWSKFSKNIDFRQNILEILAAVEIFENLDFSQENLDFCQKCRKSCQILSKFLMIPNLVKIFDNLYFVQIFEKS